MVEFATQRRAAGASIEAAAQEAARLRFRPIVMTSLAFVRFADDFGITGVIGAGVSDDYWLVPFDANDPVHTPRDLDLANPMLIEALRTALAAGVDRLVTASLPASCRPRRRSRARARGWRRRST